MQHPTTGTWSLESHLGQEHQVQGWYLTSKSSQVGKIHTRDVRTLDSEHSTALTPANPGWFALALSGSKLHAGCTAWCKGARRKSEQVHGEDSKDIVGVNSSMSLQPSWECSWTSLVSTWTEFWLQVEITNAWSFSKVNVWQIFMWRTEMEARKKCVPVKQVCFSLPCFPETLSFLEI